MIKLVAPYASKLYLIRGSIEDCTTEVPIEYEFCDIKMDQSYFGTLKSQPLLAVIIKTQVVPIKVYDNNANIIVDPIDTFKCLAKNNIKENTRSIQFKKHIQNSTKYSNSS